MVHPSRVLLRVVAMLHLVRTIIMLLLTLPLTDFFCYVKCT